jgi:hypothetical protein
MKEPRSMDFTEIFGLDEIAPVIHREPAKLVIEDELFDVLPGTGAGDALCQRAVDADFIAEVTGYTESEAVKAMTPVRSPVTTGHVMSDFVKRSADVLRKAPERAVRIQEIVDLARNQPVFRPVRHKDELWARLHKSIENYVVESVLAES